MSATIRSGRALALAASTLLAACGLATVPKRHEEPRTPMQHARRAAAHDPRQVARIVSRRPMSYRDGADPALDRPAHVRAASGLAWVGTRLAVIQDDAHFVALVEPLSGLADALPLPAGPDGKRLFDDARGTKHLKLDLEACFSVQSADAVELYALGSGSKARRERVAVLRFALDEPRLLSLRLVEASPFYGSLHAQTAFSGSELNLEGVVLRGDTLLLLQRGNGARERDREPVNAVAKLSFSALRAYLERPEAAPVPALLELTQYDLGKHGEVSYAFTDGALAPDGSVLFLASAEASSDAVSDGAVHGTYLGSLDAWGAARTMPLLDEQGELARLKAEGLVVDPRDPERLWVVVDMDDPELASELLEVRREEAR